MNGLLGAADCAIFAEVVFEESGMRVRTMEKRSIGRVGLVVKVFVER